MGKEEIKEGLARLNKKITEVETIFNSRSCDFNKHEETVVKFIYYDISKLTDMQAKFNEILNDLKSNSITKNDLDVVKAMVHLVGINAEINNLVGSLNSGDGGISSNVYYANVEGLIAVIGRNNIIKNFDVDEINELDNSIKGLFKKLNEAIIVLERDFAKLPLMEDFHKHLDHVLLKNQSIDEQLQRGQENCSTKDDIIKYVHVLGDKMRNGHNDLIILTKSTVLLKNIIRIVELNILYSKIKGDDEHYLDYLIKLYELHYKVNYMERIHILHLMNIIRLSKRLNVNNDKIKDYENKFKEYRRMLFDKINDLSYQETLNIVEVDKDLGVEIIKEQIRLSEQNYDTSQTLFQYTSSDWALESIEGNYIFLNSPNKFNDATDPFYRLLNNKNLIIACKEVMGKFGVACLTYYKSDKEKGYNNQLLWSHYANKHQGVCIEYELLDDLGNIAIEKVNYTGKEMSYFGNDIYRNEDVATKETFLKMLYTKHEVWEYENEIRLAKYTPNNDDRFLKNVKIKAIYLGKEIEESCVFNKILDLCKQKGISVYRMYSSDFNLWELEKTEL